MYLIVYNQEKAQELIDEINNREGVPYQNSGTKTMCSYTKHPTKEKYAVRVSHLTHRSYLSELFAQERVEELSEDWFGEV